MHNAQSSPHTTYLTDYRPSDFAISSALLKVDLNEDVTQITSQLHIKRSPTADKAVPLVLDGDELVLKQIALNGAALNATQYQIKDTSLTLPNVPDEFTLDIVVLIKPQDNTRLSGLYKTNATYCTQCESRGFRRITYFLDRPDVLTRFTTVISADKQRYPVLLSNGNLVEQGELPGNRHWVRWEDPTLKPCYLYALVAGNLDHLHDTFVTQSGRTVQLYAYVEQGKREQAIYALQSVVDAMRWDEETYGREYDLDIFMIVGVSDFNFGAMENKGLNIFNDKYILASKETATDSDFVDIKNVVGHEYFHNWSGNRVTVRDWFQITLKEGLTVFRDQQFIADKTFPVVRRIQQVQRMRNFQFVQDAGPMAHPIYPDSYIEINNFYTVTVYEKGCEVIGMLRTLLGKQTFRKAMDLYFSRHDGHPATTKDFVQAMQDESGIDLTQFWRWYKQAGTPLLQITTAYDAAEKIYTMTVTQSCPPTPGQPVKEPFHIPLVVGLLDQAGNDLPLQLDGEPVTAIATTRLLNIQQPTEVFRFINIPTKPTPSLLRNFSAPVRLEYDYRDADYVFLMAHDSDLFNRWDASQQLATRILLAAVHDIQQRHQLTVPQQFLQALRAAFHSQEITPDVIAEMLVLPTETYLLEQMTVQDVEAAHTAREWLRTQIAQTLRDELLSYYRQHAQPKPYALDARAMGERRLKNVVLAYLAHLQDAQINQLCWAQFEQADNMTDTMGALAALNQVNCPERQQALAAFYQRWQDQQLVVYKWFTLQAQSTLPNTLQAVKSLIQHPAFEIKNPNCTRALIGAFCSGNIAQFHAASGEGYVFLVDYVLKIDQFNPQLAARIVEPLIHWQKFDSQRQGLMKAQLERIAATKPLSNDVYELVSKSLEVVK